MVSFFKKDALSAMRKTMASLSMIESGLVLIVVLTMIGIRILVKI